MTYADFEFNTVKAYLITFRGRGTWLHGDERGSVDRNHNAYATPRLPLSRQRRNLNLSRLKQPIVKLGKKQRHAIAEAIDETCRIRKWDLWIKNVRTNPIHSVITAPCKPERVLSALKANATRKLRESNCWNSERSPWADKGSKKYLWTEQDLINAIT